LENLSKVALVAGGRQLQVTWDRAVQDVSVSSFDTAWLREQVYTYVKYMCMHTCNTYIHTVTYTHMRTLPHARTHTHTHTHTHMAVFCAHARDKTVTASTQAPLGSGTRAAAALAVGDLHGRDARRHGSVAAIAAGATLRGRNCVEYSRFYNIINKKKSVGVKYLSA
jgi:hypothetical protein